MSFRELILNNLGWKLSSLFLAIATWSMIHYGFRKEGVIVPPNESPTLDLPSILIGVRTRPDDTNRYEFHPTTAHMVLTGSKKTLERIKDNADTDIDAYLDLANANLNEPQQIEVRVGLPEGVSRVSIVPSHLMVKKIKPPRPESETTTP